MINQLKAVMYCRVNSLEQLYAIPPGSKISKDYLDNIPKVYEKLYLIKS